MHVFFTAGYHLLQKSLIDSWGCASIIWYVRCLSSFFDAVNEWVNYAIKKGKQENFIKLDL